MPFGIARKTEIVTDDSACQLSEVRSNMAIMSKEDSVICKGFNDGALQ